MRSFFQIIVCMVPVLLSVAHGRPLRGWQQVLASDMASSVRFLTTAVTNGDEIDVEAFVLDKVSEFKDSTAKAMKEALESEVSKRLDVVGTKFNEFMNPEPKTWNEAVFDSSHALAMGTMSNSLGRVESPPREPSVLEQSISSFESPEASQIAGSLIGACMMNSNANFFTNVGRKVVQAGKNIGKFALMVAKRFAIIVVSLSRVTYKMLRASLSFFHPLSKQAELIKDAFDELAKQAKAAGKWIKKYAIGGLLFALDRAVSVVLDVLAPGVKQIVKLTAYGIKGLLEGIQFIHESVKAKKDWMKHCIACVLEAPPAISSGLLQAPSGGGSHFHVCGVKMTKDQELHNAVIKSYDRFAYWTSAVASFLSAPFTTVARVVKGSGKFSSVVPKGVMINAANFWSAMAQEKQKLAHVHGHEAVRRYLARAKDMMKKTCKDDDKTKSFANFVKELKFKVFEGVPAALEAPGLKCASWHPILHPSDEHINSILADITVEQLPASVLNGDPDQAMMEDDNVVLSEKDQLKIEDRATVILGMVGHDEDDSPSEEYDELDRAQILEELESSKSELPDFILETLQDDEEEDESELEDTDEGGGIHTVPVFETHSHFNLFQLDQAEEVLDEHVAEAVREILV